jgi:Pyridoxamine 5'-phosphate oxidase
MAATEARRRGSWKGPYPGRGRIRVTRDPYSLRMRWEELSEREPRLAEVAHDRLIKPGVLLVATIRRDGTPRLSPVEPLIFEGDLWLSMMWQSHKAMDLLRDDRILLHSIITSREGGDGEVKLRGRAVAVDDRDVRARYCDAVSALGWRPEEPWFHLFRIGVEDLTLIRYAQSGDQHVVRWPTRTEFVRRETSATSVGPPEPDPDFFAER